MIYSTQVTIKNGGIVFKTQTSEKLWRHNLRKFDGKKVVISLETKRNYRSNNQNRYYWMCLDIISESTGNTANDLHSYFARKYLPIITKPVFGINIHQLGSTTDLSVGEFVDYMSAIQIEVAEYGITLPDTKEYFAESDKAPLKN